jgi:hypothetical protein
MDRDEQDLRRLAWAHYIAGAVTALLAIPGARSVWQCGDWVRAKSPPPAWLKLLQELDLPPDLLVQMLIFFFASITLMVLLHAAIMIWIGWCLARARRYWVVFIFSMLDCTYLPVGTIVGVWAVMVLNRPSVKARFGLPSQRSGGAAPKAATAGPAATPPDVQV